MSAMKPPISSRTDSVGEAQLSRSLGGMSLGPGTQKEEDELADHADTLIIHAYLKANVPIFARLCEVRQKGWENPAGDVYFQRQRQTADNADEKMARIFYNMMKDIGADMNAATGAFEIDAAGAGGPPPRILDMCMAPGAFLEIALARNPGATAVGFSLPEALGGHKVLAPLTEKVRVEYLDITMLAGDLGLADRIPADHPDRANFLPRKLGSGEAEDEGFHLVLCDGQVLRTHARAEYRERGEARRLTLTQLVLGLERLRPGGTVVALLHRVESWNCVRLLRDFCGFADVALFKPARIHAKRSSFYMVARDVRSRCPEALAAVARWKEAWEVGTLRLDEGEWEAFQRREPDPHEVLREFGEELVRLGTGVWEIQAKALERAPFTRGRRG